MDPFIRRLIERLHDPATPLSRNRHFHTFDTPEGRRAIKTSRRLKSLQRDLLALAKEGRRARVTRSGGKQGEARIEIQMERVKGRRTTVLEPDEFALLEKLPGVKDSLAG
jgi:hypothetical protein